MIKEYLYEAYLEGAEISLYYKKPGTQTWNWLSQYADDIGDKDLAKEIENLPEMSLSYGTWAMILDAMGLDRSELDEGSWRISAKKIDDFIKRLDAAIAGKGRGIMKGDEWAREPNEEGGIFSGGKTNESLVRTMKNMKKYAELLKKVASDYKPPKKRDGKIKDIRPQDTEFELAIV